MSVLDDLALYLEQGGVATRADTLFANFLPDEPDTAMGLFEYSGIEAVKPMASSPGAAVVEQPFVQILSRSSDSVVARAKAQAAHSLLDGFHGTLNGNAYGWIAAMQPPFYMQRDQNDRVWFSFNIAVKKSRTT